MTRSLIRIATLAAVEWRASTLADVLRCIAPQVDEVQVYLDRWSYWPVVEGLSNVRWLASEEVGEFEQFGKFLRPERDEDFYHIVLDDDVLVPDCFVDRLVAAIDHYQCVCGVWGSIVRTHGSGEHRNMSRSRVDTRNLDRAVNWLSTAACGWFSGDIHPWFDGDVPAHLSADIWLARECQRQSIPMVAIQRSKGWVQFTKHYRDPRSIGNQLWRGERPNREAEIVRHDWKLIHPAASFNRRLRHCC